MRQGAGVPNVLRAAVVAALVALAPARAAMAQTQGVPLPAPLREGEPLALVWVDLRDASKAEVKDDALEEEVRRAFGIRAGTRFRIEAADMAIREVRKVPGVREARWAIYDSSFPGELVLVLFVEVGAREAPRPPKGWLATGDSDEFPKLFESERALLRVQVNGGLGFFNDHNSWWGDPGAFVGGSPLFPDPAGKGWATWGEASVEAGLHGAVQIGPKKVYGFGNVTAVAAGSAGQDPWRSDARLEVELEKAYAGLLWVVPEKDFGATVSFGKQTWQLNKGFLFSQYAGGFNAADWGASYLAARTALQDSVLAKVRLGRLSLEGFLIDPQEYYENDSGTRYRGANLQYADGKRLELGAVWYDVPRSRSTFVLPDGSRAPREGLRTVNLRAATATLGGVPGLSFESEWAHQSSSAFRMSADAWYASLGYEAAGLRWSPSLTYRYAFFEGDDPETPAYERFDAPQSSGSDTWLQGNIFKKTVVNSNLESHRVRFAVKPSAGVSVILNYFYLWADELNNRGGARPLQQLTARTLGQEVDLHVNWSVSRNLFVLGLAGIAFPGPAIDRALAGGASPWATIQLSLFWNL